MKLCMQITIHKKHKHITYMSLQSYVALHDRVYYWSMDCAPVLLSDPLRRFRHVAYAAWFTMVLRRYKKTVRCLQKILSKYRQSRYNYSHFI